MFCERCGVPIGDGQRLCQKCKDENKQVITQVTVIPSGTTPLVMGLLGLFGGFIPIVKYITGLLSLLAIFVGASQRKKLKRVGLPTGKATAGIVLGTIAVLITVITIAFSAMVIGSLFSGGGSPTIVRSPSSSGELLKNSKRINFFTNNLPQEIQGTAWSNGNTNVEFGKNKVKLNDDWYSVKKIRQSSGSSGPMFTWVYFDDYYATLWGGELNRLYREGARADDFLSGFKTPAEIEAERIENERITIENERITKEITGVWEGRMNASGGMGMKLTIYGSNGNYSAIFDFFSLPGISNSDVENGSMRMNVSYINGEYQFEFGNWIVRPRGYESIDFKGRVQGNVLSGENKYGRPFNVEKKN